MISSNSSIGQVNAASSEAPRYETVEERNALDREDFMTLFITQLQYQDPMKPLESAEMATQIAQFNMVDLLNRNNDAMEQLVASEAANAGMQALNFLGHEVRYSGNLLILTENGMKPFDVELDRPAAAGTVSIIDASGKIVNTWETGAIPQGRHPLFWDGTDMDGNSVPDGVYMVAVQAVDEQGEEISVSTWTTGSVSGLDYQENEMPMLRLDSGMLVSVNEIWMITS